MQGCLRFVAVAVMEEEEAARRARRRAVLLRIRSLLRERNVVSSQSLPTDQEDSVWYKIYATQDTHAFISVVSVPPAAFALLLEKFEQYYIVKSGPGKRGRPPRVTHKHAVLALLLHFYTHATEHKTLVEVFAFVPSTLSRVLANAERALSKALLELPDAAVRWPSMATQKRWASLSNEHEPLVDGVFAFVDGKNFPVQQPSDADRQNAMYNGESFIY